jgi:Domain of unknown function (DUF4159)
VKPRTLLVLVVALAASGVVHAQYFGRRSGIRVPDNEPPPAELILSRWHFGTNGLIGHMGWSHNYPESEIHLNEFVERTTRVDAHPDAYRLLELGSPEIFEYPFAFVSEPGEMEMTEQEVVNLREYLNRGGFILIDDFDGDHMNNLREEMHRVFPDRNFERLTADNPLLDIIFAVDDLTSMAPYVAGGEPVYYGLVNDRGEIAIVACHNNDLANFWEWYGLPQYPLKPATDAFRIGANIVVHAFTH